MWNNVGLLLYPLNISGITPPSALTLFRNAKISIKGNMFNSFYIKSVIKRMKYVLILQEHT